MREPDLADAERKSFSLLQRYSIDEPGFNIDDLAFAMDIDIREGGLEDAMPGFFAARTAKASSASTRIRSIGNGGDFRSPMNWATGKCIPI